MKERYLHTKNIFKKLISLPSRIKYRIIRWGFFLVILYFPFIGHDQYDAHPYLSVSWIIRGVVSLFFLTIFAFSLKRKGDDKSITDLKKDFIAWMQAHRIKEKRLETGFALTKYSTIIFAIHLLFETYYEPPMFMGNGTLVFGLGTTIVTFFSVILLPVFLFIVKTPFIETLHDFIPLWLLAISSSIGNILLISAYFARNRLKRKDFQKKYLLFTIICTICAFFPPRLEISYHSTFLFGYTLWLTAFFTLFIGLLLIYKNSDE